MPLIEHQFSEENHIPRDESTPDKKADWERIERAANRAPSSSSPELERRGTIKGTAIPGTLPDTAPFIWDDPPADKALESALDELERATRKAEVTHIGPGGMESYLTVNLEALVAARRKVTDLFSRLRSECARLSSQQAYPTERVVEVVEGNEPGLADKYGELLAESANRLNLLETAWGIIANVSGSDWKLQSQEWQEAAAKWRRRYHYVLKRISDSDSKEKGK